MSATVPRVSRVSRVSRVVVVGAGLGGLAAAARLAAQGHHVTVLERAPVVGGKLGLRERDGFRFDTGPSLVTWPDLLRELFADTGGEVDLGLRRLDPAVWYRFPDGTELELPGRAADVVGAIDRALGAGSGEQWQRLLDGAEKVWDLTHHEFLESPITARQLLRFGSDPADLRTVAPWRSLRRLGRSRLDDPRLRAVLDRYATYSGSDPRRAPAVLQTVAWLEQARGSWYVDGGLRGIVDALAVRLQELGADVVTGAEVAEVLTDADGVTGVALVDGTVVDADVVVSGMEAASLLGRMVTGPRRRAARRVARAAGRATASYSGFAVLLALDDPPPGAHHRVLFAEHPDPEFDALQGRDGAVRAPTRPTVYLSAPDDPGVVPGPGTGAWFLLVNAPRHDPAGHDGIDWDAPRRAEVYAERLLALTAERGLDLRPHLRWHEVRTPADLERETGSPGGAIYGTSSDGARAAFLRPANASPVPGLYLVGGSAHPGGGLPLVLLSARIVAGLVGPAA